MKKRVILVHGWDGSPERNWFPWLRRKLEAKGFVVVAPQLPDAGNPRREKWIPALTQAVGTPDKQTYFVGHSMGCQAIARYLEALPKGIVVGGTVFVAGFFKRLTGLRGRDEQLVKKHWLDTPLDFNNIRSHMAKSIAIFSDNDPFVPLDNQDDFRDKLGSKVIMKEHMWHFTGEEDGTLEFPVILASLLQIAQ